ncbi:MAG: 3'-5' exonuclease, partial [Nitrospinota bacterium]
KRKIIREIISLLQFLDSPIDNLKFVEFITGEIFMAAVKSSGLSPNVFIRERKLELSDIFELLFRRVEEGRRDYLYIWFKEHHPDLWQSLFEYLFNKVGYLPLYELVSLIYRTFKVFEKISGESAFLIRFLESIGSVEGRGMNNIKDFLEIVSEEGDESILEVFLPDYIDAVKVMTFHKAKGLGFPVVINMIYDGGQGRKDSRYFEKDREKIRIHYIVKDFCDKSSKLAGLYSEKELDERIQDLNLLYVANTRAEKELYNIIIHKKRPTRYLKELFDNFENGKPVPICLKRRGESSQDKDFPGQEEPRGIIIPDRESFQFREEGEAWSIERIEETRRGEFFHEILSRITFEDEKDIEEIIKNISATKKEKYDKEKVGKIIIEFLSLEDVRKWFKKQPNRQILREVEYVDEDGSLYRMDRLVIDPERITVIDFKTGEELPFPDKELPGQAYRKQIKKYMKLLEKLYPQKECKGYLAFIEAKLIEEV